VACTIEILVVSSHIVGGDIRLAGVHVCVLPAVGLLFGPVRVTVTPKQSGVVAEPILDQFVSCREAVFSAVDPGPCSTGVREKNEGVTVR